MGRGVGRKMARGVRRNITKKGVGRKKRREVFEGKTLERCWKQNTDRGLGRIKRVARRYSLLEGQCKYSQN